MSRQYEVSKLRDDLIKIFDEEYENRRIITADFTAEKLNEKGYRKESEVAEKIFAELETLMLDGEIGGKYPAKVINPEKYAELKNKYKEKAK